MASKKRPVKLGAVEAGTGVDVDALVAEVRVVYPKMNSDTIQKVLVSYDYDAQLAMQAIADGQAENALDEWSSTKTKKKKKKKKKKQDASNGDGAQVAPAPVAAAPKKKVEPKKQPPKEPQQPKAPAAPKQTKEEIQAAQKEALLQKEKANLKAAGVGVAESGMRKLTIDQLKSAQPAAPVSSVFGSSTFGAPSAIGVPSGNTHPGVRSAMLAVDQQQQAMEVKYSEARLAMQQNMAEIRRVAMEREIALTRDLEQAYMKEMSLLQKRKAHLATLADGFRSSNPVDQQGLQVQLDHFNAFVKVDAPSWSIQRYTGNVVPVVSALSSLGNVQHAPVTNQTQIASVGQPRPIGSQKAAVNQDKAPGQNRPKPSGKKQQAANGHPDGAQPQRQNGRNRRKPKRDDIV